MQKWKASSPATQKIADMLVEAFNGIEPKLKGELRDAYRNQAKDGFDSLMDAIDTRTGPLKDREFRGWYEYANFDRKAAEDVAYKKQGKYPPGHFGTWEDFKAFKKFFKLDYRQADKSAEWAFDHARDSFVYKNMAKLEKVLEKRREVGRTSVFFQWKHGIFEGNVQVYLPEGGYFRAEVSLKYVIRRIPRVTPYFQYPLIFTEAEVGGKSYKRPSEEELRVLLGGLSMEKLVQEKKAQAVAEGWCAASGTPVPAELMKSQWRAAMPWAKCTVCGAGVSAQRGVYRKHKTPAAEKKSAAAKLEASGYCPKSREKVSQAIIEAMGPVEPYKDPKVQCEHCGQMVRLDSERDWIPVAGGGYPTRMKVKSARYYKHKMEK